MLILFILISAVSIIPLTRVTISRVEKHNLFFPQILLFLHPFQCSHMHRSLEKKNTFSFLVRTLYVQVAPRAAGPTRHGEFEVKLSFATLGLGWFPYSDLWGVFQTSTFQLFFDLRWPLTLMCPLTSSKMWVPILHLWPKFSWNPSKHMEVRSKC